MATTAEEKIFKLIEELKEEVLAQRHLFNSEWNGAITFRFETRNGGICGNVQVEKNGRVVKIT